MTTVTLPFLAIVLLLVQGVRIPPAHAASSPLPLRQRIIVHTGAVAGTPTVDAETAALLDEAVLTAAGNDGVIQLQNSSGAAEAGAADRGRTECQTQAMHAYLVDHGIRVSRIEIATQHSPHQPVASRAMCESGVNPSL